MILPHLVRTSLLCLSFAGLSVAAPANARSDGARAASAAELPAYLQCVPYAREVSGIRIFGDAHTWWKQAQGRYKRGNAPKVGAVMAFKPTKRMTLGHVAAVTRIVDSRTVLLDHANWSPINGRRGQIERGVKAVDVSPANDWSQVRVWYHPLQGLGKTRWPVHGFIYGDGKIKQTPQTRFAGSAPRPRAQSNPVTKSQPRTAQVAMRAPEQAATRAPVRAAPSSKFSSAFSQLGQPRPAAVGAQAKRTAQVQPKRIAAPSKPVTRASVRPTRQNDPFASVIALYD